MWNMFISVAAARKSTRATHASSSYKLADFSKETASRISTLGLELSAVSSSVVEGAENLLPPPLPLKITFFKQGDVPMIYAAKSAKTSLPAGLMAHISVITSSVKLADFCTRRLMTAASRANSMPRFQFSK